MAEFIDVEVVHNPGDPPDVYVVDDRGKSVALATNMGGWQEDENGVWSMRLRIQHNEVEKL